MILISCRRNFESNIRFAEQLEVRDYPNLSKPGAFTPMSQGALLDAVKGQHIVVLVHGFKNPFKKDVAPAYRKVEKALADGGLLGDAGYGLVLGFLWPGFQTTPGFFPAVPHANRSAGHFRTLLKELARTTRTIDVQAHSLGARVVLQAAAFKDELWIDNLMLIAPAVDNECLEPKKEFHATLDSCRRCLVYHSDKDQVLRLGYVIGTQDRALGCRGPQRPHVIAKDCPEVFIADCRAVVSTHSGYRDEKAYFAHWKRVLNEEPLERFEKLQPAP